MKAEFKQRLKEILELLNIAHSKSRVKKPLNINIFSGLKVPV